MEWRPHITVDPGVMRGTACIAGTRIPVSVILDNLAVGMPAPQLLDEYPSLRPEHLAAAIAYAADVVRERIVAIPA